MMYCFDGMDSSAENVILAKPIKPDSIEDYSLNYLTYPEPAADIAMGIKRVEYRSWSTDYRGNLVIHSSNKPEPGFVDGYALCIVELTDVIKYGEKNYGWILENPRMIKPVRVKGQQFIWEYTGTVAIIPEEEWCVTEDESDELAEERWASFYKKYWEPIVTK